MMSALSKRLICEDLMSIPMAYLQIRGPLSMLLVLRFEEVSETTLDFEVNLRSWFS